MYSKSLQLCVNYFMQLNTHKHTLTPRVFFCCCSNYLLLLYVSVALCVHTYTCTYELTFSMASWVLHVEPVYGVPHQRNGDVTVGGCHVEDARGQLVVCIFTLEDRELFGGSNTSSTL